MFKFKPYHGADKYHFRIYQKLKHPFLVCEVNYEKRLISGYVMTTSPIKTKRYYRLIANPNSNDSKTSYITSHRITDSWDRFSRPFNNWHLNINDQKVVDSFEKRKLINIK